MTGPPSVIQRTDFVVPPTSFISKEQSTTPRVDGISIYDPVNINPITITNFLKGQEGQYLRILGDGNTTIADNAFIRTNTGANKLLAADIVYRFSLIEGIWYEDE